MIAPMPPGGWPLRLAIFKLATGVCTDLARQSEALLAHGDPWENQRAARQILWNELVFRHTRGEIVVRGRLAGKLEITCLPPGVLRGATADYDEDSIDLGDMRIYNVQITEPIIVSNETERQAPSTESVAGKPGPKSKADEMLRAVAQLAGEGKTFPTKKARWAAVLKLLGKGENDQGYTYKTFSRLKLSAEI